MTLLVAYAFVFIAVVMLVMALRGLADFKYDYTMGAGLLAERRKRSLDQASLRRTLDPLVVGFSILVRRLGLKGVRAKVQRDLMQAGNPWGYRSEEYIGWALTVGVLVGGTMALLLLATGSFTIIVPLIAAAISYFVVLHDLQARGDRRRVELERQLPYFLDLTAMSMGAGSTFLQACESALARPTHGPLEEEIDVMMREVRAGTPLTQALGNITKRIESAELAQMVQAVQQGEELGTPLARVFEQQSDLNRYRRTKRGEQLAAKLPNRLAVPTVFLMLAVFLLLFGPIVVRAARGELV